MTPLELKEIRDYWIKKYPSVDIVFYPRLDNGKYRGKMTTYHSGLILQADTVGELISQGEKFLRENQI